MSVFIKVTFLETVAARKFCVVKRLGLRFPVIPIPRFRTDITRRNAVIPETSFP